ncbi:9367_t:CDS:2, partial [Dentiscutata heterogama]
QRQIGKFKEDVESKELTSCLIKQLLQNNKIHFDRVTTKYEDYPHLTKQEFIKNTILDGNKNHLNFESFEYSNGKKYKSNNKNGNNQYIKKNTATSKEIIEDLFENKLTSDE